MSDSTAEAKPPLCIGQVVMELVKEFQDSAEAFRKRGNDEGDVCMSAAAARVHECFDEFFKQVRALQEERAAAAAPCGPRLHPATENLVVQFSLALRQKLLRAQEKYGHGASWQELGQQWALKDCQRDLLNHVGKGDPLDVAAYCAFLWSKGLPTSIEQVFTDVTRLREAKEAINQQSIKLRRERDALSKVCREMRHSLRGEGWTEELLQKAFGDAGLVVAGPCDSSQA